MLVAVSLLGVVQPPGDAEVAQQDSLVAGVRVCEQDVRGLDVAVQQLTLVRVVERIGHRIDDADHHVGWHAVRIPLCQQPGGVGALDVIHRNPQMPVDLPAVVYRDDVGMPQGGGHVGFAVEPLAVFGVGGHRRRKHLERVLTGKSGMLGQVDLAHPP